MKLIAPLLALLLLSCLSKKEPKKVSSVSEEQVVFNNDSAQQVLLNEYLAENAGSFHFQLENSSPKEAFSFREIAPIFRNYCTSCHREGGNAPFELTSLISIQKRAKAIREALLTTIMPPWRADDTYMQYHNSQDIPDSLREQLIHWIDQGTPVDAPDAVALLTHHSNRLPDRILPPTREYELPSYKDDYICNIIDPQFDTTTFISGIAFHSSNIDVIHHYTLYVDTSGKILSDTSNWECKKDPIVHDLILIDAWAKGMRFIEYEAGLAYRFPKASKFLLQTHYSGYGNKGKKEACTMNFYFPDAAPQKDVKWQVVNKFDLLIPAHTVQKTGSSFEVKDTMTLVGLIFHMHYLGQKAEVFAVTPEGAKLPLLRIPEWSYDVQNKYMLEKPVVIPAGSTIYNNVVYDNTANNPEQPNDPIKEVVYNQSSYDEMLAVGYYYVEGKAILPHPTVNFADR
jgi:hypothetical protein